MHTDTRFAYAQTPGLVFITEGPHSHETCAGKLYRLTVPGQTYFCMDVPHSIFKDFITLSQVEKEYYTFDVRDNVVSPVTASAFQAAITDAVVSSRI